MTRGIKIRLIAFLILSAVGIVYVAGSYLGLVDRVLGRGLTVHATLPGSGGGAGVHFKLGAADLEVVGVLGGGWHCLWAGCGTARIFYYLRVSPARKIIRNY